MSKTTSQVIKRVIKMIEGDYHHWALVQLLQQQVVLTWDDQGRSLRGRERSLGQTIIKIGNDFRGRMAPLYGDGILDFGQRFFRFPVILYF